MQFGTKLAEADLTSEVSSDRRWIKNFKEGETKIRFLQEIGDWLVYKEHYNPGGSYFPCTETSDCPGCNSDNERMKSRSRRAAANALVGGHVDVYKIPIKLTNRLHIRADRYGTITDRDYLITRVGKDKDTEYDTEALSPTQINLSDYKLHDIQAMLQTQFLENWPDFTDSAPAKRSAPTPKASGHTNYADSIPTEPADPPSEPAAQQDEEQQEFTYDQLAQMDARQLTALCQQAGVTVPGELTEQREILDWMVKNFS